MLLEKMAQIMKKGSLDNHNEAVQYTHSLNHELRKRELQRITEENTAILRRLQEIEPFYHHLDWERSSMQHEEYMRNIMEYADAKGHNRSHSDFNAR